MKTIALVAIAAGLANLGSCRTKHTDNSAQSTDNLTEGIVINNAEVFANDANATASATDANAADANAATDNAQ
jgi:hypothetical protein